MTTAGRALLLAVLLLAVASSAAVAQTKGKGASLPLKDPMVFYLANGEPDSCGPGCAQWIAAEGTITQGTAARMRALLKRNGSKRPIYFNSPGGITAESLAMGRLMRERGIRAGVARTIPVGCETAEKNCAAKRSGREVIAHLTSVMAQCNSACVYAIVGARVREIAPEAHLGIHAAKTVIVGHLPKNVTVPPQLRDRFRAENLRMIRRYLAEMGIPGALLDAAEAVPHESVRTLSREDMVGFNIDTRRVVESGWIYDDGLAHHAGIFKSIDMNDAGGAEYRKTLLQVSCFGGDKFMVGYAREVGPKENSFQPLKFVAASEEFRLTPPAEPLVLDDVTKRYDVRRASVPMRAFESAAAENRIELASEAGEGRPVGIKLSTIGLASALSSLARRCSQEAPASGGVALVPRQTP